MTITVREVVESGPLAGARVLAGASGLDRVINYVDVMEVPDAENWVRKGLLIVTSLYAIRDDEGAQCRLIEAMARSEAAGLAIKLERFLGKIPEKVINKADRYGIPIIEVPSKVPYVDITHPILTAILHEQASRLEQSHRIHELFTRVALEGGGFAPIARVLCSLLQNPAGICDTTGRILAWADGGRGDVPAIKIGTVVKGIEGCSFKEPRCRSFIFEGVLIPFVVYPIWIESGLCGYLLVYDETGQSYRDDTHLIVLEHAGTVTALEMAKQAAVFEVERRMRQDLFDDLIRGNLQVEKQAQARAAALGWKFVPPVYVVVADIDGFGSLVEEQPDEHLIQKVKDDLIKITERVISRYCKHFTVVGRSDSAIAIVNVRQGGNATFMVERIVQEVKRRIEKEISGVTVSLGVSGPCYQLMDIGPQYKEACELMKISRIVFGPGNIATEEKLDVYKLFYHYEDKRRMSMFCKDVLGALHEHDVNNGTDLINTLRVYLSNGGSIKTTSASLYIHRNTLRYRLRRIEEITGYNLKKPRDRFRLALALHMDYFIEL